jgi:DNA-directed RNA polymerase specialized sigma24 family protein
LRGTQKDGTFGGGAGHIIGSVADRRGQAGVMLTAVARMILRDEYAAKDAVQDTFIEAWRSLPGLREPDKFEAWTRRILVRACLKSGPPWWTA